MQCKHLLLSAIVAFAGLPPKRILMGLVLAAAVMFMHQEATAQVVNLGSAANFGVLAGSKIENTGSTSIGGDIGSFPTATITGFPPGTFTGVNHAGDAIMQLAKDPLGSAYTDAATRAATTTYPPVQELGTLILSPGVYNDPSSFCITDAGGVQNARCIDGSIASCNTFCGLIGLVIVTEEL